MEIWGIQIIKYSQNRSSYFIFISIQTMFLYRVSWNPGLVKHGNWTQCEPDKSVSSFLMLFLCLGSRIGQGTKLFQVERNSSPHEKLANQTIHSAKGFLSLSHHSSLSLSRWRRVTVHWSWLSSLQTNYPSNRKAQAKHFVGKTELLVTLKKKMADKHSS